MPVRKQAGALVGIVLGGASVWGCTGLLGDFAAPSGGVADAAPGTSSEASVGSQPPSDDAPAGDGSGTQSTPAEGGADAQVDATSSASVDASVDVAMDAPPPTRELYVITQQGFQPPLTNDLVAIDLAQGSAVRDQSMDGAVAMCYANGSVYVARGSGQTRISILDVATLNVSQTVVLPADPAAAVFTPGCSSVFVGTSAGQITKVSLPAGTMVGQPITAPLPAGVSGSPQLTGLALDTTGTQLGVTEFNGSSSSVAILYASGTGWAVGLNVASAPVSGSNCGREAVNPSFSPDSTLLSTFDPNCETYDVYTIATGQKNATASAQFARASGTSVSAGSVWDHLNQVWSTNIAEAYRTSETGMPASFTLPASAGGLAVDDTGSTLYFVAYDPHTNGAFTVNLTTGATTPLNWNLGLVPTGSGVSKLMYVVR